MYKIAVIGLGLMGSSALRHLAEQGVDVVGIGPAEPADWATHTGVFASHYDQGRITRIIDPDPVWSEGAARAIAAYADLEARSGVTFHHAAGCVRVSEDTSAPDDNLLASAAVGAEQGACFEQLEGAALKARLPALDFGPDAVGLLEAGEAGYVNPRSIVAAQMALVARTRATVCRHEVTALRRTAAGYVVEAGDGTTIEAQRVLVCAGAWSNRILPRPLLLQRKAVGVLMAELDDAEAQRLATIPAMIYRFAAHPELFSIYSLPPIRYPDGKSYLKIGATEHMRHEIDDSAQLEAWFRGDDHAMRHDLCLYALRRLIPELRVVRTLTKPCVMSYTQYERPYIDQVEEQLYVAVGGCGAAGKSGIEWGRMGAELALSGRWQDSLAPELFRAVHA